jgi:hypothetical protein
MLNGEGADRMPNAIEVKALEKFQIWVKYSDGVTGVADLSELKGKGVFSAWSDEREFQKVHLGDSGQIRWSEQIELCPDSIYLRITGQKPEDLFPSLKAASTRN